MSARMSGSKDISKLMKRRVGAAQESGGRHDQRAAVEVRSEPPEAFLVLWLEEPASLDSPSHSPTRHLACAHP